MSSPVPGLPDQLFQHFGRAGLQRFSRADLVGAQMPGSARAFLESTGVPQSVAPYFQGRGLTESVALGVVAAQELQLRVPAEFERWLRIGCDGRAHLCVRPNGVVEAVLLVEGGEDMFVNSDVHAFAASLLALDRAQPLVAASSGLQEAAKVFRDLNAELRGIDRQAFAERESWWPRVLDDVRHTLNFPFSAAFEYVDEMGSRQTVTESTGPGLRHPEEILWQRLSASGVQPRQVRRVYCELEPCLMPGHYCALWLQATFPHAEFTHSFDYGSTAESREAGLQELIRHAAEQARRQ
ncbi:SUKH-4 family immunity protein [Streptomyces lunaelactis]|uniref:nucleic acid/nucleotide deaminase domain-containing protein n=1 Tax=Streptomyces lunaelactis TaxID=1535768 RepID=UPI0015854A01|nr:nucleic acid/nucleotide deaminase domain-containing protein [Streptomyces lunaelactis]NUL02563.1 SUKH-4 family immunity protein [Streptomyces lunaelactis]